MLNDARGQHYCLVPILPERKFGPEVSNHRARLIRTAEKKWVNGTVLHYCFLDENHLKGDDSQKKVVRDAFEVWMNVGIGIKFLEVEDSDDAEIKIGFDQNDGSWSYVGREILKKKHTMNFGWDLTSPGEIDTAIHEIGHTLGFPHEHQNPNAGIVWDEESVYTELSRPPNNWSREDTFYNIIRKIDPDTIQGTKWDPDSIMHYPFGPGLIKEPKKYQNGLSPTPGISKKDISQVKLFYPPLEKKFPELKMLKSELLEIKQGEQKNFQIIPTSSREYNFRTFGDSDTVMVLFEEDEKKNLHYVKGDDDSGTNLNSQFQVRLIKERRYLLKIRLYYKNSAGNTAVMFW